jgi:hypothetical protein
MNLDLADEETEALPKELDNLIDGDRYQFSARIRTLKAIRAKLRPEPVRELLPPPPKPYAPPRASAASRRGYRRQALRSEQGSAMTLGNAAAASVRLIVWCRGCDH